MKLIVCAANKMPDGTIIMGVRHFCPLMHQNIISHYGPNPPQEVYTDSVQGFVDNHGEFHNRTDAYEIAFMAGQVSCRPGTNISNCELYSEDLY